MAHLNKTTISCQSQAAAPWSGRKVEAPEDAYDVQPSTRPKVKRNPASGQPSAPCSRPTDPVTTSSASSIMGCCLDLSKGYLGRQGAWVKGPCTGALCCMRASNRFFPTLHVKSPVSSVLSSLKRPLSDSVVCLFLLSEVFEYLLTSLLPFPTVIRFYRLSPTRHETWFKQIVWQTVRCFF